ncbi:hypothetical protein [Bradyrhizobium sp. 27S5]|uniref:hypothetical protein n=1 Tax=Bradyrhizobium sp. 27S5 TaxID=3139728 RepID=UPI0030D076AA
MVQKPVRELCKIGAKLTDGLSEKQLQAAEKSVNELTQPLGEDDIESLISLLPQDGDTAFGINWSILHAIEASPAWPLWSLIEDERNEWVRTFRLRLANGGFHPPSSDTQDEVKQGRPH